MVELEEIFVITQQYVTQLMFNSRHLSHKFDLHTDVLDELWSSCDFFLRHWQMPTRKMSHGRLFRHISFQLSLEGTGEAEPILGMLQQMATSLFKL